MHHFDFYRFHDPREWIDAGFRETFNGRNVSLVEWPEKAAGLLPPADVEITLAIQRRGRVATLARELARGRALPRRSRAALLAAFAHFTEAPCWSRRLLSAAPAFAAEVDPRVARVARRGIHARDARERAADAHQFFFVKDPERLVVDLEGMELNDELKALPVEGAATTIRTSRRCASA